jgi:hypothetical protein
LAQPLFSATDLDLYPKEAAPPFVSVSPLKLAVLSVLTFNLYQVVWFYRNWKSRRAAGEEIRPLPRAIFGVFFFPSLASRVREKSLLHDLPVSFTPTHVAVLYIVLHLTWRLPDPLWLISCLSFVPLLFVQRQINTLNSQLDFPLEPKGVPIGGILAGVVGSLMWLLVLLGLVLPEA